MVKYTGRGLVVKRPGVLSKVQMLTLVLGVGVFSLLPTSAETCRGFLSYKFLRILPGIFLKHQNPILSLFRLCLARFGVCGVFLSCRRSRFPTKKVRIKRSGDKIQEDVNGEKLTVKKWWIFGADFFTVYSELFTVYKGHKR